MAEATPGRSGAADAHGGRTGDEGRGGGTCRSGRRPRAQAARLSMGAYLRRRGAGSAGADSSGAAAGSGGATGAEPDRGAMLSNDIK